MVAVDLGGRAAARHALQHELGGELLVRPSSISAAR